MVTETVEIKGHIIDSLLLPKVLDIVTLNAGSFIIEDIKIGRTRDDESHARIKISAHSRQLLEKILELVHMHGAVVTGNLPVRLKKAHKNAVFPEGFYATTNLRTSIYLNGKWVNVADIEMDCGIKVDIKKKKVSCIPVNDVKKGDLIVTGHNGLKVFPVGRHRKNIVFSFMESEISSEKPKELLIGEVSDEISRVRKKGEKVIIVAGPAIVHTGAGKYLEELIKDGFIDVLFAGNALAAHDIEYAFYGTSLGIYIDKGVPAKEGHRNHIRAINKIRMAGSIKKAVEKDVLKSGIMHSCVTKGVPFVLAGSIRDDGPLPDVITDVIEAQKAMRKFVKKAGMVLMVATTLHSIAVGNLLPASVRTVCVDISHSVVTKLIDRGSFQSLGIVTDCGLFLKELLKRLRLKE